jgi:predicted phosphodiesterase
LVGSTEREKPKSHFVNPIIRLLPRCTALAFAAALTVNAEPALRLSTDTVPFNGRVEVTLSGAKSPSATTDWIGLYEADVTPSGNPPSIWWANLLDLGVTDGNGTFIFDPAAIPSDKQSRYASGKPYRFIVAYAGGYVVSASVSFAVATEQSPLITSFENVTVVTPAGTAPALPATVLANTGSAVEVAWDSISPSFYARAGSFTVRGHAEGTGVVAKASVTVEEDSGPLVRFGVISDVHIRSSSAEDAHTVHFKQALRDIQTIDAVTALDALCIVGDFTDDGSAANYANFSGILDGLSHPPVYYAIGNHEIMYHTDYAVARDLFLSNSGMPAIYHERVINGYEFLFLGSESGTSMAFDISETQLDWLESKLSAADDAGKPAFVFIHEPISNTVAGSEEMQDITQSAQLKQVLSRHPNSILFSGHTHCILTSGNEFLNDASHFVNTASVAYLWYGPTWTGSGGSQGLYVDVYKDKVVVKSRDFEHNEWIPAGPGGGQETIEIPLKAVGPKAQGAGLSNIVQSVVGTKGNATIRLNLPSKESVTVSVFDISGKSVAVPLRGRELSPGAHTISWPFAGKAAGCYQVAVQAGTQRTVVRMLYVP